MVNIMFTSEGKIIFSCDCKNKDFEICGECAKIIEKRLMKLIIGD